MNFTGKTINDAKDFLKSLYKGNKTLDKIACFFNRKKSPKRTEKFVPVCSEDFVARLLMKLSELDTPIPFTWEIGGVNNSRKEADNATQHHMVKIYPEFEGCEIPGLGRFTVMFFNAADGSTRFVTASGFNVNACANGCVWREIASYATKHIYIDATEVIEKATDDIVAFLQDLQQEDNEDRKRIAEMTNVTLTPAEQVAFARKALEIKLSENQNNFIPAPSEENPKAKKIELISFDEEILLAPLHNEHKYPSIWNIFQTVQENLRGNLDQEKKRQLPKVHYSLKRVCKETGNIIEEKGHLRSATKRVDKYKDLNIALTNLALDTLAAKQAA